MGQNSHDVISIEACDDESGVLQLTNGARLAVEEAVSMIAPAHYRWGYLFQSRILQHQAVARMIGPVVGTVRVVTFLAGADVRLIGALWKIPRRPMIADNLWRGGMLAAVDVATGEVGRMRGGTGPAAEELRRHPDTGAEIAGTVLPHWPQLIRLTCQAAGLLSGLPLVGWDIAIGTHGPVFIEANTIPSLDLLQYASGTPALPPDLRAEILAEVARLQRQGRADRSERKKRLNAHIRSRLGQSLGFFRR